MTSQPNYPTVTDQINGLRTLRDGETHMEATDRVFRARMASKPWAPPTWDCRTPSGHHFTVSFSTIEQRDAVEAHWLDRHDYCKVCEVCDGCSHPDCSSCSCD